MSLTHLTVVSIPVSDQERAKQFYAEVLGFEVVTDAPMGPDQRWIQLKPAGSDTTITLVTWFDTMPAGSLRGLVLGTTDIDADYFALDVKGLTFHGPVKKESWGTFATFDDPDGNGWVLSQISAD